MLRAKLILAFLLFCQLLFAQQLWKLDISYQGTSLSADKLKINRRTEFPDSLSILTELQRIRTRLQTKGYIVASIDTIKFHGTQCKAHIYLGNKYKWTALTNGNVPSEIIRAAGFKEKTFKNKTVTYRNVERISERLLRYSENNGYPFTVFKLDSIRIVEDKIQAKIFLEKNRFFTFDSLRLIGDRPVSKQLMQCYLGIKPGTTYNESIIKQLSPRIKALPYITEIRPAQILFIDSSASVSLFLKKKNASQFDGILGYLPDPKVGAKLTGDIQLRLLNAFKRGELLALSGKKLPSDAQQFRIELAYPYLLGTPLGINPIFEIYRQDTTYLNVDRELGLQYLFKGADYVKLFVKYHSSSLLSVKSLKSSTVLPDYADVSTIFYGISTQVEQFDYKYNPRKGFYLFAEGSTGKKEIQKNPSLPDFLYDSLTLNSTIYSLKFRGGYFYSPGGNHVLLTSMNVGGLFGNDIFKNELFRIGGIKGLRGFDEASIFASEFLIGTLEYRFLIEQNSYLFTFFDQGYYRNYSRSSKKSDKPFGFGAGLSFETKAGIFSISYALGKQLNNPINFQTGKIHFGIISYF